MTGIHGSTRPDNLTGLSRRRREAAPEAHYLANLHSLYQFPPPFLNPFFRPHLPSYPPFLPPSLPLPELPALHYPPIKDHVHLPHIHIIHPPPSPPPPPPLPPSKTTTTPPPTTTKPPSPKAEGCKNYQGSSVGCFSG